MKQYIILLALLIGIESQARIDRRAVVTRNNPHITQIDTLASLTVGNGEFAFTADVTGLQTLHQLYRKGVPLGTMAQWGWHSFPNTGGYVPQDVLRGFDFGRGREEWYSCQLKDERSKAASDYLRANPHRLHLGIVGFAGIRAEDLSSIDQTLNLWDGILQSKYNCKGRPVQVQTWCHPQRDMVTAAIDDPAMHSIELRLPYPTGQHSDDACNWDEVLPHRVEEVSKGKHSAVFRHVLDGQAYYIRIAWMNASEPKMRNGIICVCPTERRWSIGVEFTRDVPEHNTADLSIKATRKYWNTFWERGGIVDFGKCKDSRAKELERRVVLSQYLLAVQCAGSTPPQETGLTYNSWFGKFHLEMIWWHQAHFALWGHPELMARTLPWYKKALPMAREIARRQGFDGARWMKMTDPSGAEAPSNVGSFLIWQQPHLIYLCELMYRATKDKKVITEYASLVDETARFMASFVTYNKPLDRYELRGCIPAQETLKAAETVNPPFELSYWHFALSVAQEWRKRQGLDINESWERIIGSLSPLAAKDGVYAASENSPSYVSLKPVSEQNDGTPFEASELSDEIKLYSDHMAVLGACGVLPQSPQYDMQTMSSTLEWVLRNWNWDKTWGWDFPTTCMTAVRTGHPNWAVDALLKECRTNTYLPNGHNYQDSRLRCYLPRNGGLLTAVALMCTGWDGCNEKLPGFPHNGLWDVEFEGIVSAP